MKVLHPKQFQEAEAFLTDTDRLKQVARDHDYSITWWEAATVWYQYSDIQGHEWLSMKDYSDTELMTILLSFCEIENLYGNNWN